jgi:hypothetical protein
MKQNPTNQQRQSKRKQVKPGVVAIFPPDRPIEFGNILDISRNGLSFITNNTHFRDSKNPVKMDMLLINENIFQEHVNTAVISEKIWADPLNKISYSYPAWSEIREFRIISSETTQ